MGKHEEIIQDHIKREMETLFPQAEGCDSSAHVEKSLRSVAIVAFREGQNYALSSLMTIDDVARELGVSVRRAKAIAREMHDRYGVGWLAPAGGGGLWLFRPEEIDILRPGPGGRPRGGREARSRLYAVYEEFEAGWWRRIVVAKTPEAAMCRFHAEMLRRRKRGLSGFQSRLVLMNAPPPELHESELPERLPQYGENDEEI